MSEQAPAKRMSHSQVQCPAFIPESQPSQVSCIPGRVVCQRQKFKRERQVLVIHVTHVTLAAIQAYRELQGKYEKLMAKAATLSNQCVLGCQAMKM